jgi:anhydro-N-acetylmuramic acid kinase
MGKHSKVGSRFSKLSLKARIKNTLNISSVISSFIENIILKNLDAVCSHGHTILHQPKKEITLQIGNLPEISSITQQVVVCDFRVQDVLMGGQGVFGPYRRSNFKNMITA